MRKIRAFIADDQPIVIEGLRTALCQCSHSEIEVAGATVTGQDLLPQVLWQPVDLLILELNLPAINVLDAIKTIRDCLPEIKILVYTRFSDPVLGKSALREGANGCLLKSSPIDALFDAVGRIFRGELYSGFSLADNDPTGPSRNYPDEPAEKFDKKQPLTRRELEILNLIAQAHSSKEIAGKLFISDQTVSVHRKNIMRKLGVTNTAGLLKAAFKHSLIS